MLLMPALSPTMTQVRCGGGRVICSCGGGRVICSEGWAGAAAAAAADYFQGNIAAWLKKVGDKISPGDAIAELETDKVRAPRRPPPFLPDASLPLFTAAPPRLRFAGGGADVGADVWPRRRRLGLKRLKADTLQP